MKVSGLIAVSAMAATSFAGAAWAHEMDTDEDGFYSLEEIRSDFPDLTGDEYAAMDTDLDGQVDPDELAAARVDGPLKPSE